MNSLPDTLTDHPSLIGIVRLPDCTMTLQTVPIPIVKKFGENDWRSITQDVQMARNIESARTESVPLAIEKNEVTDFYPYTYYILTDGEAEPLILQPQYMGATLTIKGDFAISNSPIERFYPTYYKGSTDGKVYNITNASQSVLVSATNEGMAMLNQSATALKTTREGQLVSNIITGATLVGSFVSNFGGGDFTSTVIAGQNLVQGVQAIKEQNARVSDMLMTPSSISTMGVPSSRRAFDLNGVRVIKMTITEKNKQKIRNYIIRYGNKFNNYATIDLNTYKGYVQMIDPVINGEIDNEYIQQISTILTKGVRIE